MCDYSSPGKVVHIPLQEVKYLIAVVYIEHDTQTEDERESSFISAEEVV